MYFTFLSNDGTPKGCKAWGKLPPLTPPLSTGLCTTDRLIHNVAYDDCLTIKLEGVCETAYLRQIK